MTMRTRKLIGTIATIVFLAVYCLIAMAVGGMIAVGRGLALELAYFVLAGVMWLPAVMVIIRWMSRPDAGN
jgi:hypothetical protein